MNPGRPACNIDQRYMSNDLLELALLTNGVERG
jgi:hypothetical protein